MFYHFYFEFGSGFQEYRAKIDEKAFGEDENYSGLDENGLDNEESKPINDGIAIEDTDMKKNEDDTENQISQNCIQDSSKNQIQNSIDSIRSYKGYFWFNAPFASQAMAGVISTNINKFIASVLLDTYVYSGFACC